MLLEANGPTHAVHATAVAVEGQALLICGCSGAGKSRLAFALVAASRPRRRIALIGDDRILLTHSSGTLTARPHPRIAGFIERRGLGIVAMPHTASAPLGGIISIGAFSPLTQTGDKDFPLLQIFDGDVGTDRVLSWWGDVQTAAWTPHSCAKAADLHRSRRKD